MAEEHNPTLYDRLERYAFHVLMIINAVLCTIPGRTLARMYLLMYRLRIPTPLRKPVLSWWCWHMGAKPEEAEKPLEEYESLLAFFTRKLKPGLRHIEEGDMVMPVDGKIISYQMLTESESMRRAEHVASVREAVAHPEPSQHHHHQQQQRAGGASATTSARKRRGGKKAGTTTTSGTGAGTGAGEGGSGSQQQPGAEGSEEAGDEEREEEEKASGKRGEGVKVLEPSFTSLLATAYNTASADSGGGVKGVVSGVRAASAVLDRGPNAITMIKGVPYRIHDLLGIPPPIPPPGYAVHILNMYLGPMALHHFHSPVQLTVTHRIRIPGHVGPTHAPWYRLFPASTWSNERVVLVGQWKHGFFAFVAIAASAFVAQISIQGDPDLQTNRFSDLKGHGWKLLSGTEPPHAQFKVVDRTSAAATSMATGAAGTKQKQQKQKGQHKAPPLGGSFAVPVAGTEQSTPWEGLHVRVFDPPLTFAPGDEVGSFAVGSGLSMVFEAPIDWAVHRDRVTPGSSIPIGGALAPLQ